MAASVVRRWVLGAGAGVVVLCSVVLAGLSDAVREHDGITRSDPRWLADIAAHRSAGLVHLARLVDVLGASAVVGAGALVVAYVLWRLCHRWELATAPVVAVGLAAGLVTLGKHWYDRARPPLALRLVTENEPSFPSGHTTDATALIVTVALVIAVFLVRRPLTRVLIGAGALLVAGAVGLSRLELGVHWPTDVLAGWTLGTAIAVSVTMACVALTPAPRGHGRPSASRATSTPR